MPVTPETYKRELVDMPRRLSLLQGLAPFCSILTSTAATRQTVFTRRCWAHYFSTKLIREAAEFHPSLPKYQNRPLLITSDRGAL